MAGEESSRTDVALLELLLTYAIPQKDVQPLARALLARFGSLDGVIAADASALGGCVGLGPHSVALLKLVDWIRTRSSAPTQDEQAKNTEANGQQSLFDFPSMDTCEPPEPHLLLTEATGLSGGEIKRRQSR